MNTEFENFKEDGYVVAKLFSEKEIDCARDEVIEIFRIAYKALPGNPAPPSCTEDLIFDLFQKDRDAYFACIREAKRVPALYHLCCHQKVVGAVRELGLEVPAVSTMPNLHVIHPRLTKPGGYNTLPYHQDWRFTQGSFDSVNIWIPLVDISEKNYPLDVIPGSHLRYMTHTFKDNLWVIETIPEDLRPPLSISAKRGTVVFFSTLLLHSTSQKGGETIRFAFNFIYDNAAEPEFVSRKYKNGVILKAENDLLFPEEYIKNAVQQMVRR